MIKQLKFTDYIKVRTTATERLRIAGNNPQSKKKIYLTLTFKNKSYLLRRKYFQQFSEKRYDYAKVSKGTQA